jgi:putative transposase
VKCNKSDYQYLLGCNKLSADVWNYCVKLDQEYQEINGKQMPFKEMQSKVKGYNDLHSKGIGLVFFKYYYARNAMWQSIKAKHENSDKVKMPYKEKEYFNTGWDYGCIKVDYEKGVLKLAKAKLGKGGYGKKQKPVICHAKTIPQNIKQIELVYRDGLKLYIKYIVEDKHILIQSENAASIDLGEIHTIASIDNNGNSIIITGRKMRSIKRLYNKEWGKIRRKMSKRIKGSRQYKKYRRALHKLNYKKDRQISDCIHKITKLYLDYCLQNHIGLVYYGDIDGATRYTKGRINKMVGQKLNEWNYGQVIRQLENKFSRYGIQLIKVKEYYTSSKCPVCGNINKPRGRNYTCTCGYTQHRDIVGAINILNDNHGTKLKKYTSKKYLRIE